MRTFNCTKIGTALVAVVLVITSACKSSHAEQGRSSEKAYDKTVATNVKKELKGNSLTKRSDIEVDSYRGYVTLSGIVDHPAEKQTAESIVKSTPGVLWYQNNLVVRSQIQASSMAPTVNEAAGAERKKWERGMYNTESPNPPSTYQTK